MSRVTDKRLLVAGLIGIVLVGIISVVFAPPPPAPTLSVRSAAPDGGMALSLWLEASGYDVQQVLSNPIKFTDTDLLFVLNPLILYTQEEAHRIHDWVAEGHILIVAGTYPFIVNELLQVFDLSLRYLPMSGGVLQPSAPTLTSPIVRTLQVDAAYSVDYGRDDVVVHLDYEGLPILLSVQVGAGMVWVSGIQGLFSNRGLQDTDSARVILNFLADLPDGAVVGFDEARHGFQEPSASLSGWLVGSPAGWGILFGIGLTIIYLSARGRRFGRAVPLPEHRLRREPVEYIQAMANLYRRSGQREAMLVHYGDQMRRRLSERYAVDPRLNDNDMARSIAGRDSSINEAELRELFARLRLMKPAEADLLATVVDVDKWLRKIS